MAGLQLDFALLANSAEPGVSGKLHVFGAAFEIFQVPQLPGLIPPFAFIARLYEKSSERTSHRIKIKVRTPSGEETTLAENHDVMVGEPQPDRDISYAMVVVTITLRLGSAGQYTIVLEVDGETVKSIPIWVRVVERAESE